MAGWCTPVPAASPFASSTHHLPAVDPVQCSAALAPTPAHASDAQLPLSNHGGDPPATRTSAVPVVSTPDRPGCSIANPSPNRPSSHATDCPRRIGENSKGTSLFDYPLSSAWPDGVLQSQPLRRSHRPLIISQQSIPYNAQPHSLRLPLTHRTLNCRCPITGAIHRPLERRQCLLFRRPIGQAAPSPILRRIDHLRTQRIALDVSAQR